MPSNSRLSSPGTAASASVTRFRCCVVFPHGPWAPTPRMPLASQCCFISVGHWTLLARSSGRSGEAPTPPRLSSLPAYLLQYLGLYLR